MLIVTLLFIFLSHSHYHPRLPRLPLLSSPTSKLCCCAVAEKLCWYILSKLDDQSLSCAAQVNRSWSQVLSSDFFWKRVLTTRRAESTAWATLCSTREHELSLSLDSPRIPWRHKFVQLKRVCPRPLPHLTPLIPQRGCQSLFQVTAVSFMRVMTHFPQVLFTHLDLRLRSVLCSTAYF